MRSLLMYILPVYYGVYLFFVFFLPTYFPGAALL